ncbi:hypothetical protein P171DRAFT_318475, partial [Karstenula rhodostoma CBS 690.94]
LDEHFLTFYEWCIAVSIPLAILSGGLTPLIQAVLATAIGYELHRIDIIANTVAVRDDFQSVYETGGAWKVMFHDDSIYGHDKTRTIREGVSDFSAARETDPLFAKQGEDLVKYCKQQELPFTEFSDWRDILKTTQDL